MEIKSDEDIDFLKVKSLQIEVLNKTYYWTSKHPNLFFIILSKRELPLLPRLLCPIANCV